MVTSRDVTAKKLESTAQKEKLSKTGSDINREHSVVCGTSPFARQAIATGKSLGRGNQTESSKLHILARFSA
jgi:hypothetical protein